MRRTNVAKVHNKLLKHTAIGLASSYA